MISGPTNFGAMADVAYHVILEPEPAEDGGGYSVVIPAFPAAHTQGDTVDECLANAREVIALEMGYARDKGLPIPEPDGDAEIRIERVVVKQPAA